MFLSTHGEIAGAGRTCPLDGVADVRAEVGDGRVFSIGEHGAGGL